jgi:hypothetical protein
MGGFGYARSGRRNEKPWKIDKKLPLERYL